MSHRSVFSMLLILLLVSCSEPHRSPENAASPERQSKADRPTLTLGGSGSQEVDTGKTTSAAPESRPAFTDSIAQRIDGSERVFGLFSVMKGSINLAGEEPNPTMRLEVLPLAFVKDETYFRAAEWNSDLDRRVSRREKLMATHPTFDVFVDTFSTVRLAVDSVATSDYLCSELKSGRGRLIDSPGARSGIFETIAHLSAEGRVHRYGMGLAISADQDSGPVRRHPPVVDTSLSDSSYAVLQERARSHMQAAADPTREPRIRFETLTPVDFERDGTTEYVVVAKQRTDEGRQSVAFVGRFADSGWVELFRESRSNRSSAWGDGYDLVQIVDIDGNDIPEVVFKVGGYEGFSFEVYEYRKGSLVKVFNAVPYGC